MAVEAPRLIVALDCASLSEAVALCRRLDPKLCRVKIGKELFTRAGPEVVAQVRKLGFSVFLDLKFHDIPNTVAMAVRAAAELGCWMINVHASGGRAMLSAAKAALVDLDEPPLLIAVTVLTSLDAHALAEIGVTASPFEQVERLARLAFEAGLDGVVCSPLEARGLRARFGPGFRLVTPGVRPAAAAADDQRRIATPAAALAAGADYLVIGRPITQAADPRAALSAIVKEVSGASPVHA
jgi:orotidine-5'-phosphate decarboxylase